MIYTLYDNAYYYKMQFIIKYAKPTMKIYTHVYGDTIDKNIHLLLLLLFFSSIYGLLVSVNSV